MENITTKYSIPTAISLTIPDGFDSNESYIFYNNYGFLTVIQFILVTNKVHPGWEKITIANNIPIYENYFNGLMASGSTYYPFRAEYNQSGEISIRNWGEASIPAGTSFIGELFVISVPRN